MQLRNGFRREIRESGRQKIFFEFLADEIEFVHRVPIEKQAVGKTGQEIVEDYLANETSRTRADLENTLRFERTKAFAHRISAYTQLPCQARFGWKRVASPQLIIKDVIANPISDFTVPKRGTHGFEPPPASDSHAWPRSGSRPARRFTLKPSIFARPLDTHLTLDTAAIPSPLPLRSTLPW
jgi:hypothetical protein